MTAEHDLPTCERRIAGTGSRCQRPVAHRGEHYPGRDYPDDVAAPPKPPRKPYAIAKDGTVTIREGGRAGEVIGTVRHVAGRGWVVDTALNLTLDQTGADENGDYGTKWYAAKTLHDAWTRMTTTHQEDR